MGRGLTQAQAVQRGVDIVSNTASASFKLEGNIIPSQIRLPQGQFYQSKRERNVFIEKRGQRIKSIGEKQQISYKGIFANRMKRKIF